MWTETCTAFSVDAQQSTSNDEANENPLIPDLPEWDDPKINSKIGFTSFSMLSSMDDDGDNATSSHRVRKKSPTNQDMQDE